MTEERKRVWVYSSLAAVAFISLMFVFVGYIQPGLSERERVSEQVNEEEQLADSLEQELTSAEQERTEEDHALDIQQSLPVIRQTDQFISGLHTAEELAGVRIADIYMTYDEPAFEDAADEQDEQEDETAAENGEEDTETRANTDIQKQTALVDIYVSRYSGLLRFLHEVESMQRLTNIDMVHISEDDGEDDWIFDGNSPIRFEVSISSYYYPTLAEELEDRAPEMDYPPSGNREQPFLP